jgi:alpha-L-fucosidase
MAQVGQRPVDGHAVKEVFFTQKADALFAVTAGWPGRVLVLRDVRMAAGADVTLLGFDGRLDAVTKGDTVTIRLPALDPDAMPCRYAYAFRIPGAKLLAEK